MMETRAIVQKQNTGQGYGGALVLLVVGIVCTLLLSLYFGGFGYWDFPGLLILAVAFGLILSKAFSLDRRGSRGVWLTGIYFVLIGLAGFLSFVGPILFGLLQMLSLLIVVVGIILIVVALFRPAKKSA